MLAGAAKLTGNVANGWSLNRGGNLSKHPYQNIRERKKMSYQKLLEFMETMEMTPILSAVICSDCTADDCDDCPGHDIMSEVDDQICQAGLELMKKIAKEWCDAQKQ